MTYDFDILPSCKEDIRKLCAKNKPLQEALDKKIKQVQDNPHHFKPLRYPLQDRRRVHVFKSFVLTYSIDEEAKKVILRKFSHHDDAY